MVRSGAHLFLLALTLTIACCQKILLVGGHLDDNNAEVWGRFISEAQTIARNNSSPFKIGVVTCASGEDAETNGAYYSNDVLKTIYSITEAEWIPIDIDHPQYAWQDQYVDQVNQYSGIFFGGGDQERLVTCFYKNGDESPVLKAIRQRLTDGHVIVAGTSAGTDIQQATPMVTGGESYDALLDGASPEYSDDHPDDLTYDIKGGFGFFKFGFVDTHFGARGRQGRMIRLIHDMQQKSAGSPTVGFGIDENSAIFVNGDKAEIMGQWGAYVFDLSKTAGEFSDKAGVQLSNIDVSYYTKGDSLNLTTLVPTFASWKKNIAGREQYDVPISYTTDIFSSPNNYGDEGRVNPREFTTVSQDLFNSAKADSTYGESYETDPIYHIDLKKVEHVSEGFIGRQDDVRYISYSHMAVDIKRQNDSNKVDGLFQVIADYLEI